MRAALRALGWVVSELIPGQLVDAMRQRDYQAGALHDQDEAAREALVDFEAAHDGLDAGELPDHPGPIYPQYTMTGPGSFTLPDADSEISECDGFCPENACICPVQACVECGGEWNVGDFAADGRCKKCALTLAVLRDQAAEYLRLKRIYCDPVGGTIPNKQCLGCGDIASDSHQCQRDFASAVADSSAETVGAVASTVKQHSPVDPHLSMPAAAHAGIDSPAGASSPQAPAGPPSHATEFEITLHRTELIPGGNGARIGFSDDFPGRQFLIIPQ